MIANPISGSGRGRVVAERIRAALQEAGYRVTLFFDRPDARQLGECCQRPELCCGITIGGDGTVRSVVTTLLNDLKLIRLPPLLIVPMGTANLLGQHLGMHWHERDIADRVVESIRRRQVRELDAATANDQPLLIVGGVGLDAAVVHELDRIRTGPIAKYSYVLPTIIALLKNPFPTLTVTVDDHLLVRGLQGMAFIGNIPEYGTGFPVLPHARPDDNLLDVCVVPCRDAMQAVEVFLRASIGEHLRGEGVRYAKAKRIRIESTSPAPVQIDGDSAGFTPLEVELLPERIPFIVPATPGETP